MKTEQETKQFLIKYENFLRSSKTNLGSRTSKAKNAFIAEAMELVAEFVTKKQKSTTRAIDRTAPLSKENILSLKPNKKKQRMLNNGAATMTASESMRSDDQLGRSPFGKGVSQ